MSDNIRILNSNHEKFSMNGYITFSTKTFFTNESINLQLQDKDNWLKMHKFSYKFLEVTNFKEVDEEIVEINKTAGGTAVGAAIGLVTLGPFGGLIGGMAGGNKKINKKKSITFAIEFNDNEWVIFKIKNRFLGKAQILMFKDSFPQFFKNKEEKEGNPFK